MKHSGGWAAIGACIALAHASICSALAASPAVPATVRPVQGQPLADTARLITESLAAGRRGEALDAYDRAVAVTGRHDAALLVPIAKNVLAEAANGGDPLLKIPAIERLARAGDHVARAQLESEAGGRNTQMAAGTEADCALARLGDSKAIDRLIYRLTDDGQARGRILVLDALTAAKAKRAAYAIGPLLREDDTASRIVAARSLAELGARDQVGELRAAFEVESRAIVRQVLAMALHSLGDSTGDGLLTQIESDSNPDVRLNAAEAYYRSRSPKWPEMAHGLLQSSSEGARLRVAELLGPADPDAHRELARAAASANVAVREVGAKLLEASGSREFGVLVTLLRDSSALARVYAAGAIVGVAR